MGNNAPRQNFGKCLKLLKFVDSRTGESLFAVFALTLRCVQVGDDFVLNVLGEQESGPTMRHFLKRFPAGADRFEGVEILQAKNGSPVLRTSIAHIELKVRF